MGVMRTWCWVIFDLILPKDVPLFHDVRFIEFRMVGRRGAYRVCDIGEFGNCLGYSVN